MAGRWFIVRYYGVSPEEREPVGCFPGEAIRWRGSDMVDDDAGMSCCAVKRSLIEHDGYPDQIYVTRAPRGR